MFIVYILRFKALFIVFTDKPRQNSVTRLQVKNSCKDYNISLNLCQKFDIKASKECENIISNVPQYLKQGILNLKSHNPLRLYVSQNELSPKGACLILRPLSFALLDRRSFRSSNVFSNFTSRFVFSFVFLFPRLST